MTPLILRGPPLTKFGVAMKIKTPKIKIRRRMFSNQDQTGLFLLGGFTPKFNTA
jgi:hypothetical protein